MSPVTESQRHSRWSESPSLSPSGSADGGTKAADPTGHLALTKYSVAPGGPVRPPPLPLPLEAPPPPPAHPAEYNPTQQPTLAESSLGLGSWLLLTYLLSWAVASGSPRVLPAVPR